MISPFQTTGIPDIQITLFPRKSEPHLSTTNVSRSRSHIQDVQYQTDASSSDILVTLSLLNPTAKNRVQLTHLEYSQPVEIIPEVPEHTVEHLSPEDVNALAWGVSIVREIMSQKSMRHVCGDEIAPGIHVQRISGIIIYRYVI